MSITAKIADLWARLVGRVEHDVPPLEAPHYGQDEISGAPPQAVPQPIFDDRSTQRTLS